MRVVADSHAIVWFISGSARLSDRARSELRIAEQEQVLTVSVATFLDLWYVTQTTGGVTSAELEHLKRRLKASDGVNLQDVDELVVEKFTTIDRALIADPWDRLIVATALALNVPLVTRDGPIRQADVVETIW